MEADLEPPNSTTTTTTTSTTMSEEDHCLCPSPSASDYHDDDDYSNSSTPFVSAPSSPGRSFHHHYPPLSGMGFFYSAPASPMHYVLSSPASAGTSLAPATSDASNGSFEFEFSPRFDSPAPEIGSAMSSADELFLNGQIRPMKLSAHLQRPQKLAPLIDLGENGEVDDEDDDDMDVFQRARDLKLRDRSLRRRTRSLSPLRSTTPFDWLSDDVVSIPTNNETETQNAENGNGNGEKKEAETTPSGESSRCSSAGRSSKRWVFLKDFLRSKSEGSNRSNNHKFWHNISFSPVKDKKDRAPSTTSFLPRKPAKDAKKTPANGKGKRRSAHEMHYTMNRAQAEEMRKKTFLPYRQGLLGCLGFNSKSYGALNGFARALNPVSSR